MAFLAITVTQYACTERTTRLTVTTFAQQNSGEVFVENFPDGAFAQNARGNYQIALELPPKRMPVHPLPGENGAADDQSEPTPPTTPISANSTAPVSNAPDEVYIAQLVMIDMLWHPKPGTTFVESSQTNAGISYCLLRGRDTVRYEGAGFVYFEVGRDGRMTGRIESATLYPASHTTESIDVLGACRLTGDFVADPSQPRVAEMRRRLATMAKHPNRWVGHFSSN